MGEYGDEPKITNTHQNYPNLFVTDPSHKVHSWLSTAGSHIKACAIIHPPVGGPRIRWANCLLMTIHGRAGILHKSHTFQRWISQKGRVHHLPRLKRHLILYHCLTLNTQSPCRPHTLSQTNCNCMIKYIMCRIVTQNHLNKDVIRTSRIFLQQKPVFYKDFCVLLV